MSWGLAQEYGFTDEDGARPDRATHWKPMFGTPLKGCDETFYARWRS